MNKGTGRHRYTIKLLVDVLVKQNTCKEEFDAIAEAGATDTGYSKAYLTDIAKKTYDKKYNTEKYEKAKEKTEEVYSLVENM